MDKKELHVEIQKIFNEVLGITKTIDGNMSADDMDEWDSLSHIRLIITIESKFNIRFTTSEIGDPQNISQMEDLILLKITA